MVLKALCALLVASSVYAQNSLLDRKYKIGDKYQYKLTCSEYHNRILKSTVISVCELKVGKNDDGIFYDEINWISKITITGVDTSDQSNKAKSVKPYRISLHPKGKLELPAIMVPEMTQPMQDFNTFFVAVSPHLGTTELKAAGDSILNPDLIKADLSNGDFIVIGEDCFKIKMKITGITKESVMTQVAFLPPAQACFTYLLEEMKIPVVDSTINNIQMVLNAGNKKYNVQYGREIFFIDSVSQRKDGKIESAEMDNTLNLKVKINCGSDYKDCAAELPFTIQRNLILKMLGDN